MDQFIDAPELIMPKGMLSASVTFIYVSIHL